MKFTDLEMLRSIFMDKRVHLAPALVEKVEVLSDRSKARAQCMVYPDEFQVIAEVSWSATGPDAGMGQLPVANDLVLVAFASPDDAYIIGRLSSKEDTIPARAKDGHLVLKALSGKKAFILSGEGVGIGGGGATDPDEPLVLGNVLTSFMGEVLDFLDTFIGAVKDGPVGMGNLGNPTPTYPALATALETEKAKIATMRAKYLTTASTNIVSGLHMTER